MTPPPPAYGPPPSTRVLTVTKWITVVVSVLLTAVSVLWVMQLQHNVDFLEHYTDLADKGSGDGQGLKGGEDAIAKAETNVVIGFATLVAIALLGVFALLAGLGLRWARVLTAILTAGPMVVIVYGALDGGSETGFAFSFLVPFIALTVLWCLPGVTRAMTAKRARRAGY